MITASATYKHTLDLGQLFVDRKLQYASVSRPHCKRPHLRTAETARDYVCCIQTATDLCISCVLTAFNKDDDDVRGTWTGMTNYRIEPHRTMSNHVCKRELVISKAMPKSTSSKSTGISFRANKPPRAQLAHYKLRCHKSSNRTSVAYMSRQSWRTRSQTPAMSFASLIVIIAVAMCTGVYANLLSPIWTVLTSKIVTSVHHLQQCK